MNETTTDASSSTDSFYLPAAAAGPTFERIGAVLEDLLDSHGVVLIPDSYNE
jgi:hypothetical protein